MLNDIRDILARRDLMRELVVKNLKVRYSRPLLGYIWPFLMPFFTVCVFYIIFSVVLRVKIKEAPFFLYLMSAIFPWRFFQDSLMASSTSLLDNKNLIREATFPHYFIPLSIVVANMINFLPSLVIVAAISFITARGLPAWIIFLPAVLVIQLVFTAGLSIMVSILYVKYRDIKYMLEIALLALFYMTPVFYSIYLIKSSFSPLIFKLYLCNPLVGIVNFYRVVLLKGFYPLVGADVGMLYFAAIPFIFCALTLYISLYYYRRNKRQINDYLSY